MEGLSTYVTGLTPLVAARLDRYAALLAGVARDLGLVGFGPEAAPEHIARSLLLAPLMGEAGRLVDVGSGAGLPGIPLAIARGGEIILLEPRRRAVAFLEQVVRELDLLVEVAAEPAELAGRGPRREWADAVVARSLASPAVAVELCAPLCALGGRVVLTAGPHDPALPLEVLARLGLGPLEPLTLRGIRDLSQRVLIMSKVSPTPEEFPRRPGVPRRRPLGGGGTGAQTRNSARGT